MHSAWLGSTFLRVLKFLQIKEGRPNFWGEPILQEDWIISSPLLYLNIKSFVAPNSSSFIRFQSILHDAGVLFSESSNIYKLKREDLISGCKHFCEKSELFGLPFCVSIWKDLWTQIHRHLLDINAFCMMEEYFSRVLNFLQIKERGSNFWVQPILHKVWIIWSPLLYLNFKGFVDPNSSWFIRFQYILHDSGLLFSQSWNFYKSKRGDQISRGNKFCRTSELFRSLFCFSILKVLWTQVFFSSLDFNTFCVIQ